MKYLLTILALITISLNTFAQDSDFTKLDDFFAALDQDNRFNGSVAVT